jgi:WD40 repeat protein
MTSDEQQEITKIHRKKNLLATAHSNNAIRLWDLKTKKCLNKLDPTDKEVVQIEIHNGDIYSILKENDTCFLFKNSLKIDACEFDSRSTFFRVHRGKIYFCSQKSRVFSHRIQVFDAASLRSTPFWGQVLPSHRQKRLQICALIWTILFF